MSGFTLTFTPQVGVAEIRCVSGNGNDTYDGTSMGSAKREISSAYADLPATGGTIMAYPGRYANFVLTRGKPVEIIGMVKPTKQIGSTNTTPLTGLPANAAVIYNSGNATSLIDTIGGKASDTLTGCRFVNLVFELSGTSKWGIHAIEHCFGEVYNCCFFADKTTSPAPDASGAMWVHNDSTSAYGGDDGSWWRVRDNYCVNTSVGVFGNPPAVGSTNSNNQHVISGNIGLGLTRLNLNCLPFVSLYGGNRCTIRDNNIEAYHVGILMDRCYGCTESGDGGEGVDVFIDLYSTHGCFFQPVGIQYKVLGNPAPKFPAALLVRGDVFTKRNLFMLAPTADASDTNGVYQPTDDPSSPAVSFASVDNEVYSPRWTTSQGVRK